MNRTGPAAWRRHLGTFFAVDDDWERPGRLDASDVVVGVVTLLVSGLALELYRGAGAMQEVGAPVWAQWLAVGSGSALLVGRRRWPLTVAVLASVHLFVLGVTAPALMAQISMQLAYFVAYYSAVAWGRARRETLVVVGTLVTLMFVWLAWQFALGSGVDEVRRSLGDDADGRFGVVGPVTAYLLLTGLVNVLYFGGAVVAGQVAWRAARQREHLADLAHRLDAQSEQLRRRAVVDERLRIARELHDVVAHHVSVIGVQAAAARRVLSASPERLHRIESARTALGEIEQSSREAVHQMRGLLGALRADGDTAPPLSRAADSGVEGLAELVRGAVRPGFEADYTLVETPDGEADRLPVALSHSLFRVAQEALANVQRHSTARRASVVLRVDRTAAAPFAELEVTDDGRPRSNTSGSGLGQLGIRERVASHRGTADIGPRATGGYRVRVRLPLTPPATERSA